MVKQSNLFVPKSGLPHIRLYLNGIQFGTTICTMAFAISAAAQSWTNGTADNNWFTNGNWDTNAAPNISDSAIIGNFVTAGGINILSPNAVAANLNLDIETLRVRGGGKLFVSDTLRIGQLGGFPFFAVSSGGLSTVANFDFRAGSVQIFGAGSILNVSNAANVFGNLNIRDGGVVNINGGAGTLTLGTGGSLNLDTGGTLNAAAVSMAQPLTGIVFSQTDNATFSPTISGLGSVSMRGSGVLTLSGTNTFSGGTSISSGTINLANVNALGTGTIQLIGAGRLLSSTTGTLTNEIDFSNGTLNIAATTGQTLTVGGRLGNGTQARFGSDVGNGTVVLAPTEAGLLAGGFLSIDAGTLKLGNSIGSTFVNSANNFLIASGAILDIHGFSTTIRGLIFGDGSITNNGASATLITSGNLSFNGVIQDGTGQTSLTVPGGGKITFTGANSYSGLTTIESGALLQLGDGGISGRLGLGPISNSGTILFNRSNAFTVENAIAGAGTISQIGTGSTTLTANSNSFTGTANVNAGSLLIAAGATLGSGAATINVTSGATLGGSGAIGGNVNVLGGTLAPSSAGGSLTIKGNLSKAGGTTYAVDADAAGRSSKIVVEGTATLSGGIVNVKAATGTYGANTLYTILTANGGVTGQYAGVTSNLAFLTPSLRYDPNSVTLSLSRNDVSLSSVTNTPNQTIVANALSAIGNSGQTTPAMLSVLTTIYGLTAAQARQTFDSIGGASLGAFSAAQIGGIQSFVQSLTSRLSGGTGSNLAASGYSDGTLQLADAPFLSDAAPAYAQAGGTQRSGNWTATSPQRGVWLRGYGSKNHTDRDSNTNGYKFSGSGISLGADTDINNAWRVGAALTIGTQRLSTDNTGDSGKARTAAMALYAQFSDGPWIARAIASAGRSDNDSNRMVILGTATSTARSDFNGNVQSLYGEVSYDARVAGFALQPIVAYSYNRVSNPSFTESGAGALNLQVNAQVRESLRSYFGVATTRSMGGIKLTPRAIWVHEYGNVYSAPIAAQIAGGGTLGAIQVKGPDVQRDGALIGANLSGDIRRNLSVHAEVSTELRRGQTIAALSAGLRYVW